MENIDDFQEKDNLEQDIDNDLEIDSGAGLDAGNDDLFSEGASEIESADIGSDDIALDNEIELDDDISQNFDEIENETAVESAVTEELTTSESKEDWDVSYEHEELADALKMVEDFSSLLALKDALQKDLNETKNSYSEAARLNKELSDKVKNLEESALLSGELRRDLSFVEEERNEAIKKTQDLEFEMSSIKEVTKKLKKDLEERDDLESTLLNLQERTTLLEREKSSQIESMEEQVTEMSKNKDKAERELEALMDELDSLKVSRDALNIELKNAQALSNQSSAEKEHLQNRVDFFQKEKVLTDTKINQTMKKIRSRDSEVEQLRNENSAMRKKLSTVEAARDRLSRELDVARKSFVELKNKLVNVMGSKDLSNI